MTASVFQLNTSVVKAQNLQVSSFVYFIESVSILSKLCEVGLCSPQEKKKICLNHLFVYAMFTLTQIGLNNKLFVPQQNLFSPFKNPIHIWKSFFSLLAFSQLFTPLKIPVLCFCYTFGDMVLFNQHDYNFDDVSKVG